MKETLDKKQTLGAIEENKTGGWLVEYIHGGAPGEETTGYLTNCRNAQEAELQTGGSLVFANESDLREGMECPEVEEILEALGTKKAKILDIDEYILV